MKVGITKEQLAQATNRVQGAISERSLGQIGLRANNNSVCLSATDRVLAVYSTLECSVEEKGTVFVPARLFSDVVRELPAGNAEIVCDGKYATVRAGENREYVMRIPLIDDLTWQEASNFQTQNMAEIPTNQLIYIIEQVQFCVAQDSPRNYGSVAFLHKPSDAVCRLVGTDGFRLSYSEVEMDLPSAFLNNGVCLSKRALSELSRMCQEGHKVVKLSISEDETTMLAEVPTFQLFIRLSAVKYPNYIGVLPSSKRTGVLVSRPHLQGMTKRVLLAADRSRALQLSFSDSSLTLNSKTMGSSEGRETVKLADYHGPKFNVSVNGKFLTDVVSTTGSENIALQFNQENSEDPVVIIPRSEPTDCRSCHVLVPIKQSD